MNRLYPLLIVLLILCGTLQAAIYEHYLFSAMTGTYTPINGTNITSILMDDALSESIPIGFTFVYGIEVYTEVKVSSNGWIGLGTAAPHSNLSNALSDPTPFPVLAPLWDDTSLGGGSCQYLTTGTAPNRVFTVQYSGLQWNYWAGNQHDFQVRLHENSKIEFIYGPEVGTPQNASASIGININPGGAQNFYSITPGTPPTASYLAENMNVSSFPGNGQIYVFDPVAPVPNDLAALSISGNLTPSAGTASTYTIMIRNSGTNAQSNYSVQLVSGTTVLASVQGPIITAGQILSVPISWTPSATGQISVFGRVVLTGDEYPQNNNTPPLNLSVQPAGTIAITIGSGDEQANMPVNMYWRNSLFETIYQSGEINTGGIINAIAFYNNFVTDLPQKPTKVWLGITQNTDLSGGWIPATNLTQVFDGNVDYPAGSNTIIIPLANPFIYAGGNLVMMVNRPMDTTYFSSEDRFACQTVGTNRSLFVFSDGEEYFPDNPPFGMGELSGQFPQTTFFMTTAGPNPQFAVTPDNKNFGTVLINSTNSQLFTVVNIGGGSLTVSSITLSGSPFFSLSNIPALPATLNSMQTVSFTLNYNPTAAGTHTGTITLVDNLTRTTHFVQLTGNCIDPTIYTSPYVQSFDAVTAPNLPVDWNRLITPTGQGASVTTNTGASHSTPNSAQLYNGSENTANIFLIAPPLAQSLALNAMRVKFWAMGVNGSVIDVGVIADIADPQTFTSLQSITSNGSWAEYVVSLASYTGGGRRVAFKHGNQFWFESINIDDVTIETTPQNDLAAIAVTGTQTPSVGTASNYEVTVFNWGIATQSDYTVKLFKAGDIELASVPGVTVSQDSQVSVTLSWTPSVAENTFIYGKVFLTGDQNPLNDQTPNLNLMIQSQGTTAVTIGAGDQLANIPVNMFWRNSLYETIYQSADIAAGGQITGIAFYNNFVTNLPGKPTKIWLGVTNDSDLTAGWIPSTQLTLVFDGVVNYPSGENMILIPLTTPFPYPGTNLVMLVNRPMDTTYFNWADQFKSQDSGMSNSLEVQSDDENFDPANPPNFFNISGMFPKTTFFFEPSGPDPQFGVAPQSKNFGTVLMNQTASQVFTVFNSGGAPLTVNSINLTGSPMYNLQNLPTLPLVLNSGQNATFTARYQPTAVGTHAASITITDNLTRSFGLRMGGRENPHRTEHTVPLTGTCVDPTIYTSPYAQNFDAVTVPHIPIDWQKIFISTSFWGYLQTIDWGANSTPNCVQMYNGDDENATAILIAPPLAATLPVVTMRTRFWARGDDSCPLQVGVISDPTNPATFQSVQTLILTSNWVEYVVSFQTYGGTGQNIAFKHGGGGAWRSLFIDDVMIEVTPDNDLAAVSLTGNATPSVGMTTNYTANIFNWGTNPQTTYTVKLYKQGNVELASVSGPAINPGLSAQVVLSWAPTVQEQTYIYAKVVLTGDQNSLNDQTPNLNVSVQPAGTMVVTIGAGDEIDRIPVDMAYQNSLFETLYMASELNFIGMITGLSFYNSFVTDLPNMPTNVWIGTTTTTDLQDNWIPSTSLTQVYSGNVNYPFGQNVVTITFPNPYLYLGDNLVMMVQRPMDATYYNSENQFFCQTVGTARSRNASSDWDTYDPANPPTDWVGISGRFPKTGFMVIPGGVGHLNGTVYGAGNIPLNNATVQISGGAQTTTNAQGQYSIINLVAGTYEVTASRYGYLPQSFIVIIPEDQTVTQNFTLTQMPTVNVTGTIVGSDAPTVGLAGATMNLTGYENYSATTNAQGQFTITGVYANQAYQYLASALGYQVVSGNLNVGPVNYSMGTITLSEIAYTPRNVTAAMTTNNLAINLQWLAPDPGAVDVDQSFENAAFPPTDWTQTITNIGPPNTAGVLPTWCRFGTVVDGTVTVTPSDGNWQAGYWWTYNHQDEWLISPPFNCPQGAYLTFDTYCYYGSPNADHYYVKISNNNGVSWNVVWDASVLTGGWNNYQTPVVIDLAPYTGQQIKIAWHAQDPPSNDGMWYNWFIDNVQVTNYRTTIRFPEQAMTSKSAGASKAILSKDEAPSVRFSDQPMTRATDALSLSYKNLKQNVDIDQSAQRYRRSLQGYKVWRLLQGQEQNENAWSLITPNVITSVSYVDNGWPALPAGNYKWAVKAVYTNNVLSLAAFSNVLLKPPTLSGTLTGMVRNQSNLPIPGATINASGQIATSLTDGTYTMQVAVGTYDVTCSATGYQSMTMNGVVITQGQTTICNFLNMLVPIDDEVLINQTVLKGNYPNPFNPETTIAFDVKGTQPVCIEIYNMKGQLIRTLVDKVKHQGHHSVIWNGRDEHGNSVASGVYHYRMRAGSYKADRRMMLLK